MITTITGVFRDRPVRIVIEDGKITGGQRESAASMAQAMVNAQAPLRIAGMWDGAASFDDPWAIAAMFNEILDRRTLRIDPPPPSLEDPDAPPGRVY